MPLTSADETDLLLPLYAAPHDAASFALFLERLRGRTRADAATLMLIPAGAGRAEMRTVAARAVAITDQPGRLLPVISPLLRRNRVYSTAELNGAIEGFVRIVRVDGFLRDAVAWLVLTRASRDFSAADSALLAALCPHLVLALRTVCALDLLNLDRLSAETTLRRLGIGRILLDAEARIVEADSRAAELLATMPMPTDPVGERLRLTEDGMRQLDALRHREDGGSCLLTLSGAPRLDVLVHTLPGRTNVLTGIVRGSGIAGERRVATLARLFDLPPSEARLAVALAEGASLVEAAAMLGLTIATARDYSKRLYARTGARGQADLVRRVLESLAVLA